MASAPINKIERAHQMYREGRYEGALGFYTEALGMAKTKAQKIALHSNRAACYLKLHNFKKAAEECTSVLELDQKHTGALMLRAQTLVTLKEYHSALFDVNRLMELNPSSEVYQNLQARLKTQLVLCFAQGKSLAPIPEDEAELEEEDEGMGEVGPKMDGNEGIDELEPKGDEDEGIDEVEPKIDEEEEQKETEVEGGERGEEDAAIRIDQKTPFERTTNAKVTTPPIQSIKESSENNSKGWQAIPKPKGHSHLDYSRWDRVEDESSEDDDDEDDDEESQPRYRFRVRTVGVRPVK